MSGCGAYDGDETELFEPEIEGPEMEEEASLGQLEQPLWIEGTSNPDAAAARNAGATFVGLVPKLPISALNQPLGSPMVPMLESLMSCKWPVSVYLDDEDSGNTNDLVVNAHSFRRKNALIGGFGHPPTNTGSQNGVNTLISYCHVPVRALPRARLDYMVFTGHMENRPVFGGTGQFAVCPQGSHLVRMDLDTETYSTNYLVGEESWLFEPHDVLGKNLLVSVPPAACSGRPIYNSNGLSATCDASVPQGNSLSNSGSARFFMCFVPGDPAAASELPASFDIYEPAAGGFVTRSAENFIYFARDASSGRATFYQDGEDRHPRTALWVSNPSYEANVRRIVELDGNVKWYLGWTGWQPPVGDAENPSPALPSDCFSDPLRVQCLQPLADIGAAALKQFAK